VRFWGTFPPNDVTHRPNPKKDHPWDKPCHLSHKPRKSVARFELGVCARKKRTGQDRKKVTYAKFQNEIFRGYNFTGVEFSIFTIDFEWALQQCSATALPVMSAEGIQSRD